MGLNLEKEAEIVERAQSDVNAFIDLYNHYLPEIYRYVYYRTSSKAEAEDVVSQTFLKAMENLQSYSYRGVPFSHWLYRIAAHVIYHEMKKNNKERPVLEVHNCKDFEDEFLAHLDVLEALQTLPDIQQRVITLRYISDLSIGETARILSRSEGAVKQLAFRALRTLRERMDKDGQRL